MAAYSGTPTVVRWWEVGDRYGKRVAISRDLTLTLTGQGGATNTIGKTALGFSSLHSVIVINFTDNAAQNRGIIAWTDVTNILLGDPQVVTDADRCEPIDLTGTLTIRVTGDL